MRAVFGAYFSKIISNDSLHFRRDNVSVQSVHKDMLRTEAGEARLVEKLMHFLGIDFLIAEEGRLQIFLRCRMEGLADRISNTEVLLEGVTGECYHILRIAKHSLILFIGYCQHEITGDDFERQHAGAVEQCINIIINIVGMENLALE